MTALINLPGASAPTRARRTLFSFLLLGLATQSAMAQAYEFATDTMTRRPVLRPGKDFAVDARCMVVDLVEVKFKDTAQIRRRGQRLVDAGSAVDLQDFYATIGDARVDRLFTRPEAELDAERAAAQASLPMSEPPLADLNNY